MGTKTRKTRRLIGGYTAREAALDIAIGYLKLAFDGRTHDVSNYATTDADKAKVKKAIARLHNRLLDGSKLDGMHIGD